MRSEHNHLCIRIMDDAIALNKSVAMSIISAHLDCRDSRHNPLNLSYLYSNASNKNLGMNQSTDADRIQRSYIQNVRGAATGHILLSFADIHTGSADANAFSRGDTRTPVDRSKADGTVLLSLGMHSRVVADLPPGAYQVCLRVSGYR